MSITKRISVRTDGAVLCFFDTIGCKDLESASGCARHRSQASLSFRDAADQRTRHTCFRRSMKMLSVTAQSARRHDHNSFEPEQ